MALFNSLAQISRCNIPLLVTGRILQVSSAASIPLIISSTRLQQNNNKLHTDRKLCLHSTSYTHKQFNLTFSEYLTKKRTFKMRQRITGIPFAILGCMSSSLILCYAYPDMFDATAENVQLIMGLDPFVFTGISSVVCSGIGYGLGTAVFKVLYKLICKADSANLEARESDFLHRLGRYRFGEDSKFEDDYYGETIKSLSDYRQWVRTHQKKREENAKYQVTAIKEIKDKLG